MKKLLLALALLLVPAAASAQCNGVFPNNTACGNITGSSATPRPVPLSSFPAATPGGTNGQIQFNNSGLFGGFTMAGDCTVVTTTGVITCNRTNLQSGDYAITTTDCNKTISESGTLKTLTLPAVAGFTEGCLIRINNANSTRGQKLSGFPNAGQGCSLGQNILWPSGNCAVQVVNGAWATVVPQRRWKVPAALTIYSNNGGSNTNDCLATGAANACASTQYALYSACNEYDFTGLETGQTILTVQLDNADTNGVHYSCRTQTGAQGGGPIIIQGAASSTVLSGVGTNAVGAFTNAIIQVRNITLQTTSNGACIGAGLHSQIYILDAVTFGACAGGHINADQQSDVYILNDYTVAGNAPFHFFVQNGGQILTQATVVATLSGNVTVTAWAEAGQLGSLIVPNWTVNLNTFTVTGQRASINNFSLAFTGLGTTACTNTYFPGNVNGGTSGGSQCL